MEEPYEKIYIFKKYKGGPYEKIYDYSENNVGQKAPYEQFFFRIGDIS